MPTQFSMWYHGIFIFRLWRFVAFIYFILSFLGNVTMSFAVLRFWIACYLYTLLVKITLIIGKRLYKEYKYYSHQNIYGTAFKIKIPHVDVFLRPRLISFVISVIWLETPPLFNIWCYHSLKKITLRHTMEPLLNAEKLSVDNQRWNIQQNLIGVKGTGVIFYLCIILQAKWMNYWFVK